MHPQVASHRRSGLVAQDHDLAAIATTRGLTGLSQRRCSRSAVSILQTNLIGNQRLWTWTALQCLELRTLSTAIHGNSQKEKEAKRKRNCRRRTLNLDSLNRPFLDSWRLALSDLSVARQKGKLTAWRRPPIRASPPEARIRPPIFRSRYAPRKPAFIF